MTKEKKQEFTYRITKANKTEMIAILYDMGIEYIDEAKRLLEGGDKEAFRLEVNKAKAVVVELTNSVNPSMDLGHNFISLYIYCSKQLNDAFLDMSKDALDKVKSVFSKLSEAYNEASKHDNSGPVMGNTEKIYSGLTYNKALLSNLVTDVSSNRGILA